MSVSQAAKRNKILAQKSPENDSIERSPAKTLIGLQGFELLRQSLDLTDDEEDWLRTAGEIFAKQTKAILEKWRAVIAVHEHLGRYCPAGEKKARQSRPSGRTSSPN